MKDGKNGSQMRKEREERSSHNSAMWVTGTRHTLLSCKKKKWVKGLAFPPFGRLLVTKFLFVILFPYSLS